jgi:hypothetical protein
MLQGWSLSAFKFHLGNSLIINFYTSGVMGQKLLPKTFRPSAG